MFETIGMTVLREIPASMLAGLVTGAYRLHGGVIRDPAGRIVAHLLTSTPGDLAKSFMPGVNVLSSLVGSGQIYTLAKDVAQIQRMLQSVLVVSSASTVLAGLGLVASVAGTAFLNNKLVAIQKQLQHIERLLNEQHLACLKSAVDTLRHAEGATDAETRRALLVSAKGEFAKAAHFYGSQFADPRTVAEILPLEDCFSVAVVGSALALSELGMYGAAAADFDGHFDRWESLARKHVAGHLIGKNRARLIGSDLVEQIPAAEVIASLDFALKEEKGWEWIDVLRKEKSGGIKAPWPSDKLDPAVVEMSRVLRSKYDSLDAFGAHLRLLDSKKLSASGFLQKAESAAAELAASSVCVI